MLGKVGAVRGFRADSVARAGKTGGGRQDRQVGPGAQRERRGRAVWFGRAIEALTSGPALAGGPGMTGRGRLAGLARRWAERDEPSAGARRGGDGASGHALLVGRARGVA